jgi:hypothetical protein
VLSAHSWFCGPRTNSDGEAHALSVPASSVCPPHQCARLISVPVSPAPSRMAGADDPLGSY